MSNITDKTLLTYESILRVLAKKVGTTYDDDGKWVDRYFSAIMDVIDDYKSIHTRKNYYIALVSMGKLYGIKQRNIDMATKRMLEEREKVDAVYSTNKMNEKQEENWVSSAEIDAKIKELRDDIPSAINKYKSYKALILYLVVLIHRDMPLRNDLADAMIFRKAEMPKKMNDDVNYIVVDGDDKCVLVLNNYKTKSVYHQKSLPIPKHIGAELNRYVDDIVEFSPSHWFIRDRDDEHKQISRTTFSKWFIALWDGKRVGSTQIRRTIVSELYKVDENEYKKKEELANVMGHGVEMAESVYAKVLPGKKDR